MPSGLTDKIGKGATFAEFALGCARQMGALIHMRDDASDAKITLPESSEYYQEELENVRLKLQELQKINMEGFKKQLVEERKSARESVEQAINDKNKLRGQYMQMLMEVKAWRPPTTEHNEFKNMMIQQITDSISFDCDTTYEQERLEVFNESVNVAEAFNKQIENLQEDEKYFLGKLNQESSTNSDRAKWVKDLVFSLRMTPEEKKKLLDFDV
jgi:hypothetical protein